MGTLMKDYTLEHIEASRAQLCQNAPKVASLCSTLEQVGGICFLRLKLLSHFSCPFATGLPPPREQLRAVSATHFMRPLDSGLSSVNLWLLREGVHPTTYRSGISTFVSDWSIYPPPPEK